MKTIPKWGREISTPALVYDLKRLRKTSRLFIDLCAKFGISCCYAVKANRHPKILKTIAREGLGFDVASIQEFNVIKDLQSPRILCTSPSLTDQLILAIDNCSGTLFFDNVEQIKRAKKLNIKIENHGIRLSLPGDYVALGMTEKELHSLKSLDVKISKVHLHAGEFISPKKLKKRLEVISNILAPLEIETINFGGGFGVLSNDVKNLEISLRTLSQFAKEYDAEAIIEPGKAIAARCGFLVSSVLACKSRGAGQIAIIDQSSFNLGEMETRQLAATTAKGSKYTPTVIIGPTCYEGDIWGRFDIQELTPGDRVIFSSMGAYTSSISASLHALPSPEAIFLK